MFYVDFGAPALVTQIHTNILLEWDSDGILVSSGYTAYCIFALNSSHLPNNNSRRKNIIIFGFSLIWMKRWVLFSCGSMVVWCHKSDSLSNIPIDGVQWWSAVFLAFWRFSKVCSFPLDTRFSCRRQSDFVHLKLGFNRKKNRRRYFYKRKMAPRNRPGFSLSRKIASRFYSDVSILWSAHVRSNNFVDGNRFFSSHI